ncbi:gamma-mobile-trio integrase GmtZ [Pseudomonas sp. P4795]|uniref:gamma-mobile-trio integrase GmtZ n=1 Tax=Pseudomonas sp. P4795 TaxID=3409915 RepID=UPI003B58B878
MSEMDGLNSPVDKLSNESEGEQRSRITGRRRPTRTVKGFIRPKSISVEFLDYKKASALVIANGITNIRQYKKFQRDHYNLPKHPYTYYGGDWEGWLNFLGVPEPYATLEECQKAARDLGITGAADYKKRRREDARLPASPPFVYDNFPGFPVFLGVGVPAYDTLAEASKTAIRMGIRSKDAYGRRRKEDPKLAAMPSRQYAKEWKGWVHFLNIDTRDFISPQSRGFYATYKEFKEAVRKLGVRNQGEYQKNYLKDKNLPSHPDLVYLEEWQGWGRSMAGRKSHECATWEEARKLALPYRFSCAQDYVKNYKADPRLPSNPERKFLDFPGYDVFLLPDTYGELEDIKLAAKLLKIKSKNDYNAACLKHSDLPENPDVLFVSEWIDWYDICGLPTPYSYTELQEIVKLHGCKIMQDYTDLWRVLKDPRMPYSPDKVYMEWANVYEFLSVELPSKVQYISKSSKRWADDIRIYLDKCPVKGSREQSLCRFVRHFIEPHALGNSVHEFLSGGLVDTRKYLRFLEAQGDTDHGRRTSFAVNEYLEDALKRHFTEEDENGYAYRVAGASNPLSVVEFGGFKPTPSESVKPVLAYQFVEAIRDWIVPENATTFSDLKSVHNFDGDYYQVDASVIDPDDPNCVYRKAGDQYYLWFPIHWIALYTLVSVPARGRQIMYNDSGEADEFVVELVDGKPVWVKNNGPLVELGRQHGFVTHSSQGEWGMHFTSNKTSYDGAGYDVPWIPDKLVYWLTVLKNWQRKYNPINRVTPWTDCAKRCNLSKSRLKKKGANCFLFRAFGEEQPPLFTPSMISRLAAALYFTQPSNIELATFDGRGRPSALTRYSSRYTPHSMRVSLITAYVVDFGMPVQIIMKIAGHTSIVMSVYYTKINSTKMRQAMAEGEKRALLNKATDIQLFIEQNRLDQLHHQLVANSEEALAALMSGMTGTQLVRDYGVCPYAGGRCEDGGVPYNKVSYMPAPAGYLGMQNCPRCRHFITGPVFLGGLTALWNEISLNVNLLWAKYSELDDQLEVFRAKIQEFDYLEMELSVTEDIFDDRERLQCEIACRKLHAEMEGVATKMDMYLGDMQAITKLIEDSRVLLNNQATEGTDDEGNGLKLIVSDQSDLEIEYQETSFYQQLNEVCVNATIYQSASAVLATPRRSQMIDRMALMNDIRPNMFNLSEREQLLLGNQVTDFFFKRLQNWDRVNQLISGDLLLDDLQGGERISKIEFFKLLTTNPSNLVFGLEHQVAGIDVIDTKCVA